jgi:hypothetical protein
MLELGRSTPQLESTMPDDCHCDLVITQNYDSNAAWRALSSTLRNARLDGTARRKSVIRPGLVAGVCQLSTVRQDVALWLP